MKIDVISSSHSGYIATKQEFDIFSGKAAGVCYMQNSFNDIVNEDFAKTERRINLTKNNGHHSVYDHNSVSLYLDGVPKAFAMMLNNEKMYTTSEKSGRYTKMYRNDKEKDLYFKWLEIFKQEITNKYKTSCPTFFTDSKIEKLAQENARYLMSAFTLTSMIYTTTYRQLNFLYCAIVKEIEKNDEHKFYQMLKPFLVEFVELIKETLPYIDEELSKDYKGRSLSLFNHNHKNIEEYYGDVYATTYKATFSHFAEAQRHRTLSYNIKLLDKPEYYVPPIIDDNAELKKLWLNDCESQLDSIPQALLLSVFEMGTLDNFMLKLKERKCSCVLLEFNRQTNKTLNQYYNTLNQKGHERCAELEPFTHGSRCTFPNYKCASPCGFVEGINETRKI